MHLDKYKNRSIEINKSIDDSNRQTNEPLLSFDERKREAEIRFAALIADKNIPHHIAKDILSCFQHIGKDPKVLASMSMGRTKCKNIITNVLCPVETERVVDKIQNTKFSIFIDETSDICNDNAEKLFDAFKCEMWKLQIPFNNIVALSCDNASVMIGKVSSFKTKLQSVCPRLITFPCPCHSASLAAHAATNRIPEFCEEFTRKIAIYINSSPKRLAIFREFLECFQETNRKILKLCDTSRAKAYFLFLKYALNYFNQFNAYFQASETRIHQLQTKSSNFLFDISKNFLKNTHLKPFFIDVVFSLKENQKNLNEINLGLDCEEYLDELIQQGHEDIITTVRENCLAFYVTIAEEIRKRLPITDFFLSKLNVFQPSVSLFENDRETSFNDVSFIIKTICGFDEESLKKEWIALPLDLTIDEKESLSKLNFDNIWKTILERQHEECNDELPVTYKNTSFFLLPRSRILTKQATPRDCNDLLPVMYRIHGTWFRINQRPSETLAPPTIQLLTRPAWKYVSPDSLATSGIYTTEDLSRLRTHIMFPVEKPATLNTIARGAMGGTIPAGSISMMNLLDEKSLEKIAESAGQRVWQGFITFGSASAGVFAIFLIVRLVKLIIDTTIHGYALHTVYGWSLHLLGAI
ncbi:hypothetical protein ALC57_06951 [Trachymyrmex cornetzi]|uniref:DUF4371 domain-containing protein n=1 Tax=Trachymyrmex cornetzi TaxID=471704 RepID=A0A151J8E4_9HYME|nr:hypothetical protein ALC57_06951 [Trachymyrmex cornetzi]